MNAELFAGLLIQLLNSWAVSIICIGYALSVIVKWVYGDALAMRAHELKLTELREKGQRAHELKLAALRQKSLRALQQQQESALYQQQLREAVRNASSLGQAIGGTLGGVGDAFGAAFGGEKK